MPTPASPLPELPELVDSYGSMILGASIGLLLAKGNTPEFIRDQVDQTIRAFGAMLDDPAKIERFADVAMSTAMDLLSGDQ